MLVPPESSSVVLVMMRSKSVSICNRSLARLVDGSINRAFWRGYTQIWCTRTKESLNREGRNLHRWNPRLMPNISHPGCLGLPRMVSAQFTLKMCVAASNREKKSLKPPILVVQSRSRSSMLVPPESSSAVLVMIGSKSVSICNRFHATRANSSKITISKGVPLFDTLVRN